MIAYKIIMTFMSLLISYTDADTATGKFVKVELPVNGTLFVEKPGAR